MEGTAPLRAAGIYLNQEFVYNTEYAGVTQLVEFLPSKQVVAGSSPVSRSTSFLYTLAISVYQREVSDGHHREHQYTQECSRF